MATKLPTGPGRYYWDEWKREVDIYLVGKTLWVNMGEMGLRNIKVTRNIAGRFVQVENAKS